MPRLIECTRPWREAALTGVFVAYIAAAVAVRDALVWWEGGRP